MGKSDFHERKQKRIERYEQLSEKAKKQSTEAYKESKDIVKHIPMGQPILVGHHSEKMHRNTLKKSWDKMGKSVELDKKADYYKDKIEAAKNNTSISSDDPDALELLREKLASLEKKQELMKSINKLCRSSKLSEVEKYDTLTSEFNLSEETVRKLLNPIYSYQKKGFQSYSLTNNNGKIRQVKQRIKKLESLEKLDNKTYEIGNVVVKMNVDDNRIEIYFPDKPGYNFRKEIKRFGFRWSPKKGAWQKQISRWNLDSATELAKKHSSL